MKNIRWQRAAALVLALCLSLSLSIPAIASEPGSLPETARDAATAALSFGSAKSISWAVWQEGEIIETGALDENGQTLPSGGVYGIGSVSKVYTAAAVMKLAETGKLQLDRPVTDYLPSFRMADERYRDITVRMLLNHSSGLMGSSLGSALLFGDPDRSAARDLLTRLQSQRLKADPGAFSVYCNDGFTLAELVVEAVSGQDLLTFLRSQFFRPAGLEKTYAPSDRFSDRAPIFHPGLDRPLPMDCLGLLGAGGLYATAEDLASFGGTFTDASLLKQTSLDAMAAPEYARGLWPDGGPDALSFGLGWDCVEWYPFSQSGIQALVKGGDTQYYHAGLLVLPEHGLAAAVLSSGGVSTYNELAASKMLIQALADRGVTVDETAPDFTAPGRSPMPKALLDYAGYYASTVMTYQIDVSADGTLTLTYLDRPEVPPMPFTYRGDGAFWDQEGTVCLKLLRASNGQVYLYQKAFSQLPGLGGLGASSYAAMKLPENQVSPELQAQWDKLQNDTPLLPMNERYSSQVYLALSASSPKEEEKEPPAGIPGYAGNLRIVDETQAQYILQIPGNMGRDGDDVTLRRDASGALWVRQPSGSVYLEEAAAPVLPAQRDLQAAVGADGYALWYHIGEDTAGKSLTLRLPKDAGFWLYDGQRTLTASSVLWGNGPVELPEDGLLVLAGDPGAVFGLHLS